MYASGSWNALPRRTGGVYYEVVFQALLHPDIYRLFPFHIRASRYTSFAEVFRIFHERIGLFLYYPFFYCAFSKCLHNQQSTFTYNEDDGVASIVESSKLSRYHFFMYCLGRMGKI